MTSPAAQKNARRFHRIAVGLDLSGHRGEECPGIPAFPLEERRHDHGRNPHVCARFLRVDTGIGKRVQQVVGVVRKCLRRFRFGTRVHEVVDDTFGKAMRDIVIDDRVAGVVERRRVGSDRSALVGPEGLLDIAGRRRAHCIADSDADQLGADVADLLRQHSAVQGGNVPAHRVDFKDAGSAPEEHVRCVDLVLKRDAVQGTGHQRGAASTDDGDEQVLRTRPADKLEDLLRSPVSLLVGKRVPADEYVGVAKHVRVLGDLHDGDSPGQKLSENFIDRHCHVVAGLARTEKIDIALLRQIPRSGADVQDLAVHSRNALDALVAVQALERPVGDFQHDSSAITFAMRDELLEISDFSHWSDGTCAFFAQFGCRCTRLLLRTLPALHTGGGAPIAGAPCPDRRAYGPLHALRYIQMEVSVNTGGSEAIHTLPDGVA